MTTTPDLRPLAALIRQIRPGWDGQGVTAALLAALRDGYPLPDVALAAVDAARTESTETPAGIGARLRGGWTDLTVAQPTPIPPAPGELCDHARKPPCPFCPGGRLHRLEAV